MSQFIESLEQRMLMSATPAGLTTDVQNLISDSKATRVALAGERVAVLDLRVAIIDSLKVLGTSTAIRAANRILVASMIGTQNRGYVRIAGAENLLIVVADSRSIAGEIHGKGLLNHPASLILRKAVGNDISALNTLVPERLSALQTQVTNATAAENAIYTDIATKNPSLATLIQTGEDNISIKTTAFSTAASQIEVDTAQLATDLTAIPTT